LTVTLVTVGAGVAGGGVGLVGVEEDLLHADSEQMINKHKLTLDTDS
jgi:hypothetical protein